MTNQQEPPKVFGREMEHYSDYCWNLPIATLLLTITEQRVDSYDVAINTGPCTHRNRLETIEASIEWLETTARRIMSECLEIARPMITIETPRLRGDTEMLEQLSKTLGPSTILGGK